MAAESSTVMKAENKRGRLLRRLRTSGGFSLSEMLICCLILTLSTGVIVEAVNLGIRHFKTLTRGSESQILCNTLALAFQEQLTYAIEYNEEDGSFVSGGTPGRENSLCRFVYGTAAVTRDQDGRVASCTYSAEPEASAGIILLDYGGTCVPLVNYGSYAPEGADDQLGFQASYSIQANRSGAEVESFTVHVSVEYVGSTGRGTPAAETELNIVPIKKDIL